MINNFKNKFGKPENTLVIVGDYDSKNHMKGVEPIINRKIRKLFKNNKYETYLINEYNTSKLCHKCNCENEKFLYRESKKPKSEGKTYLVHGALRCKSVNCEMIHNRDKNACRNMLKIVKSLFKGKGRLKKFCRPKKQRHTH